MYDVQGKKHKGLHDTRVPLDAIPDDETTEVGVDVPPVVREATPPGAGWRPTVELLLQEDQLVEELGTWVKTLVETRLLVCVWQGAESPLWAWPMRQPSQLPPLHEDPDLAGWNVVMPLNGLGQGVWEEPQAASSAAAAPAQAALQAEPACNHLMQTLRDLTLEQRDRVLKEALTPVQAA